MNMKNKLILIFLIISFTIYSLLRYENNRRISKYLNGQTDKFMLVYHTTYNAQKELANLINNCLVNNSFVINIYKRLQTANKSEKLILRNKLYNFLKYDFKILPRQYITQVHFHLKNSESFLRMHRPNKSGDSLIGIRPTIEYANNYKKAIDGFEQGRIYNGYRYVYPIISNNTHLGSLEISFSIESLTSKIMTECNVISNFLVKKDSINMKVFDDEKSNYKNTPFDNFYYDNKVLNEIKSFTKNDRLILNTNNNQIETILKTQLKTTIYSKKLNSTITFIPINNPISKEIEGYLQIIDKSYFIDNLRTSFFIVFTISELLLILGLFSYYREKNIQASVSKDKKLVQNILNTIPNITFVTDFKSVEYVNMAFLEFFQLSSKEQFNIQHHDILEIFLPWNDYVYKTDGMDHNDFAELLITTDDARRKVLLFDKYFELASFNVSISKIKYNEHNSYLLTLIDITVNEIHTKEMEHKAYYDPLTGVYNRNKFNELFEIEIRKAKRYKRDFSLAIIDIDLFKNFNDTYGHLVGDEVLKSVATIVSESIRDTDTFARWGGEEFTILFSDIDAKIAVEICDKLRDKISKNTHKTAGHVTVSFGVTQYIEDDHLDGMFKRCDDALYIAKDNGRNRVEVL